MQMVLKYLRLISFETKKTIFSLKILEYQWNIKSNWFYFC